MLMISYGISCTPNDLFRLKHAGQYVTQGNSSFYEAVFEN